MLLGEGFTLMFGMGVRAGVSVPADFRHPRTFRRRVNRFFLGTGPRRSYAPAAAV